MKQSFKAVAHSWSPLAAEVLAFIGLENLPATIETTAKASGATPEKIFVDGGCLEAMKECAELETDIY